MTVEDTDILPLIYTKLHQPRIADDHLHRQRLVERLEKHLERPLTLVSAPAGYGKSTLIACWLESCDLPHAWISLDEEDADLRTFLNYFLAAIQQIFPQVCTKTKALIEEMDLPPLRVLVGSLINDLVAAGKPFVLVLDDYHRLGISPVDDMLAALLSHPPPPLHLVVCTRRNPALPLASFRAQGHMTEIRLLDLQFSQEEARVLLEQVAGHKLKEEAVTLVYECTEGWIVGIRFVAMGMRYHDDKNEFLSGVCNNIHHLQDYLISEVMEHEAPAIRDALCKISVLERFCSPLCKAVSSIGTDPAVDDLYGDIFDALLDRTGVLAIALDGQRKWFRFHHLFQEFLQRQLANQFSADDIAELHTQAAIWLESKGYLEESVRHLMKAGSKEALRSFIVRNRRQLFQQEQWLRIDALMGKIPLAVVDSDPELLMIKVWISIRRQRDTEIWKDFAQINALLKDRQSETASEALLGECDVIWSWRHYCDGNGDEALTFSQSALQRLPDSYDTERGYGFLMMAASLQMVGREPEGTRLLYETLEKERQASHTLRVRLFEALGYVHWMAGDLTDLHEVGEALMRLGKKEDLPDAVITGRYLSGMACYSMGALEKGDQILSVFFKSGYQPYSNFMVRATYFLAMIYESLGDPNRARNLLDDAISYCLDTANSYSLAMLKGFQAELALHQGRLEDAENWLATFEPSPAPMSYGSTVEELTAAKILYARRTPAMLNEAAQRLTELLAYFRRIHNTRFLIEAMALQALVYFAQGEKSLSATSLEQAVALAQPKGFIRLFVDLGPEMATILSRLSHKKIALDYIDQILKAFKSEKDSKVHDVPGGQSHSPMESINRSLVDPLTRRELEILSLLRKRLRNKEIADTLFISVETVKRHTINIYQKLDVHSRVEAVNKVNALL